MPFEKGTEAWKLRKPGNVGRPPAFISNIKDELAAHPERIAEMIEVLHKVATGSDSDRARIAAAADYLDRIGFRTPKETNINVSGGVLIGTPEDYRRSMLLMAQDKEREAALLDASQTLYNGQEGVVEGKVVSSIIIENEGHSTDATLATIPSQNETK